MIYLIAGHDTHRPGAIAHNGLTEHHYTTELQHSVTWINNRLHIKTDDESFRLTEVIEWINSNITQRDLVIDIHFNNNNPRATGTEVFIHPDAGQRTRHIATEMVQGISRIVDIPVRRHVSTRDYKYPAESHIGTLGIIERVLLEGVPAAPVILLEVCFLNQRDLARYEPQKNNVAKFLYDLLIRHTPLIGNLDPKEEKRI